MPNDLIPKNPCKGCDATAYCTADIHKTCEYHNLYVSNLAQTIKVLEYIRANCWGNPQDLRMIDALLAQCKEEK